MLGILTGQRVLDSLELELQMGGSHQEGVVN